jgi:hypothetical protein
MSQAWLLDLGAGCRAAVGGRELTHLFYAPQSHLVPKTPPHANRVLPWQERLLPMLDLAGWLTGKPGTDNRLVAGVFAYQHERGAAPRYGALWLAAPPTRLNVEDGQACELPQPATAWKRLAMSCFMHEGLPVPILDLRRLYGAVLSDGNLPEA